MKRRDKLEREAVCSEHPVSRSASQDLRLEILCVADGYVAGLTVFASKNWCVSDNSTLAMRNV